MSTRNQRGQGMGEYVIILVGVAIICIAIVVTFGGKIASLFGFASDEVEQLGAADWAGFDDPAESGGGSDFDGDGGGGGGGGDGGGDGGGGGGDGGGSLGGGSGGSGGSGSGSAGGGRRGGGSGGDGSGPAGDVDVSTRSDKPQYGDRTFGKGGDAVAVQAPSDPRAGRGSAAYERQNETDTRARAATADQQHWERRKRASMAEDAAATEAAKKKSGSLGFMRLVLLIAFLLGILVIGRQTLAMRGGGGAE